MLLCPFILDLFQADNIRIILKCKCFNPVQPCVAQLSELVLRPACPLAAAPSRRAGVQKENEEASVDLANAIMYIQTKA